MDQDLDYFLSYNSADRPWADWVCAELADAKIKVFHPDWDILPGENEVASINKALEQAANKAVKRRILLLLSPNYKGETLTENAWKTLFSGDSDGQNRLIIPVLVRETSNIPTLLKNLRKIDLYKFNKDQEKQASEALITGISGQKSGWQWRDKQTSNYPPMLEANGNNVFSTERARLISRYTQKVGLINKSPQITAIIDQIDTNSTTKARKAFGFLIMGTPSEWPSALKHKLAKAIELDIFEPSSPELKSIDVEKTFVPGKPAAIHVWELFTSAYKNEVKIDPTDQGICDFLSKQKSHIFIRNIKSEERRPDLIAGMLDAWAKLALPERSANHYLLLIYEEGENAQGFLQKLFKRGFVLREQLFKALENVQQEHCLLPKLESPLPVDVRDWLHAHFPEQTDAIEAEIEAKVKEVLKLDKWAGQCLPTALATTSSEKKKLKIENQFRRQYGIPHRYLKDIIVKILQKSEFING